MRTLLFVVFLFVLGGCMGYEEDHPYHRQRWMQEERTHTTHAYEEREIDVSPEIADMQREVFRLTNQVRREYGLRPFKSVGVLKDVAQIRAEEISRHFSHTRPNGSSWESILKSYGVRWRRCGENIALGQQSAERVLSSWMNSSGHRANILDPSYTHLGVGVARTAQGRWCWTQNFLTFR